MLSFGGGWAGARGRPRAVTAGFARATELGRRIREGIAADPRVAEVTGAGLLIGIVLHGRGAIRVAEAALADGFIVNPATVDRIRLAPPYVLSDEDADAFVKAFPTWLDEVL